MEKFSNFRDPLTGINPFMPCRRRPITTLSIFRALLRFPLYLLYLLGFPTLHWIVTMRKTGTVPKGVVYVNSVSPFDKYVLMHLFNIRVLTRLPSGLCAVFPEGCKTNNKGVLSYERPFDCDSVIGLRYNDESIYDIEIERGIIKYLKWLLCFLGNSPIVEARCMDGHELEKATGVPKLSFTRNKKLEFIKYYEKDNKHL
ncbi:hypothetical protein PAEPH01_1418 [Pancytospora epiphaga]|nr:hypothetical protein PAEPH01_1418 [Pancytospora epiphaga]